MQANDVKPLNSTVEEYHKLFGAHIPIFGSCRYVDLNKFLQEFPQLMRKTVLPYSVKWCNEFQLRAFDNMPS